MRALDITGQRFGRLLVVGCVSPLGTKHRQWLCACEDGKMIVAQQSNLTNGHTQSCGCLRVETMRANRRDRVIHGGSRRVESRTHRNAYSTYRAEYGVWKAIKQRCYNPRTYAYPHYGGRGITMCERWKKSFAAFFKDMGPRPEGFWIERLDNSKGYEPENCAWVTPSENSNNRRNNRRITIDGFTGNSSELLRSLELDIKRTDSLVRRGRSPQEAADFSRAGKRQLRIITIDGITGPLWTVCRQLGLNGKRIENMLRHRTAQEAAKLTKSHPESLHNSTLCRSPYRKPRSK